MVPGLKDSEVLWYEAPKLRFHIRGPDALFLYKLLLSHLGGRSGPGSSSGRAYAVGREKVVGSKPGQCYTKGV